MTPKTLIIGPLAKTFPLGSPSAENISMNHIAFALARLPALGGFTRRFYSLAEHSLTITLTLERTVKTRKYLLWSLLNEAYFAYCPVSPHFVVPSASLRAARETIQPMIVAKFHASDDYDAQFQKARSLVETAATRELSIARDRLDPDPSPEFRFATSLIGAKPYSFTCLDAESAFFEFWRSHVPSQDHAYT
jgi:hypothetical protein